MTKILLSVKSQEPHVLYQLLQTQYLYITIIVLAFFLPTLFIALPLQRQLQDFKRQLKEQSTLDFLTKLPHRQTFHVLAKQSLALSQRYKSSLSIIRFDIDHFKSINEDYGDSLGDQVIQHVAKTIQSQCRESDHIFRFSGEEFVLLLPQTDQKQALKLANKICHKVANLPISNKKLILEISVSAGVSEWQAEEDKLDNALKRSFHALEQSRDTKKNQIIPA